MRRRAHPLFQIAAVPLVLYFLGKLIRRAGRLRTYVPALERMPAHRPALRSPEPSQAESWSPESRQSSQPGDERASVIGYQRAAPTAPPVAAEPGFTIGGDGAVVRKPVPGVH